MTTFGTSQYIDRNGDTMLGPLWLNKDPVEALQAATKQYVDNNAVAGTTFIFFSAYDHAGGITIGTSATDLTYDTEVKKDTGFTHSVGVAGVTVTQSGLYQVDADITLNTSAGSTNSNTALWVAKNGVEIQGMRGNLYTFQSGAKGSCSIGRLVNLAANDIVKVQAQLSGAGNTVATVADGSRLSLIRVGNYTPPSGTSGTAMGGGIFSFITYP